jgi:hypothetical protein
VSPKEGFIVKRLLIALLAGTAVFSVAFASAAGLIVNGGTIQAGSDTTLVCDADGVNVLGWGLETDDGLVYSVRIGGIDPACSGADMFANITGDVGQVLTKAGGAQIATGEVTLQFATPKPAAAIYDIHVFIEGGTS